MQSLAAVSPTQPLPSSEGSADDSIGDPDNFLFTHDLKHASHTSDDELLTTDLSGHTPGAAADAVERLLLRLKQATPLKDSFTELRLARTHLPPALLAQLLEALAARAMPVSVLDLSGNDYGDEVAEALAAWVPASLTVLDLSGCHLSDGGVAAVLAALRAAAAVLEKLTLSDNRLGAKSTKALGALLHERWAASLRELWLSHCGLSDATAPAVAEGVHHAAALQLLDVSHNEYALSLASPLSPMRPVTLPASLRVLNLSGNLFRTVLLPGLGASVVPCCDALEELRLDGCLEGDDAFYALFAVLRYIPRLMVLDLSRCRLTYRSGKLLSQKLLLFRALERVYLSHNLLDVEGAGELCSGLERMRSLKALWLEDCHLGNCGVAALVNSLARGAAPLQELALSENGITDVGLRDLCTLLARPTSPRLRLLVLSGNPCTLLSRTQLEGMMREQQSDCLVIARNTPLDEVACSSGLASRAVSESVSLAE